MKTIFTILVAIMLTTGCGNNDIEMKQYEAYQDKLETEITEYITEDITEKQLIDFLTEFSEFVKESDLNHEGKLKQRESLALYKHALTTNNYDEITEAAKLNYEATLLMSAQ